MSPGSRSREATDQPISSGMTWKYLFVDRHRRPQRLQRRSAGIINGGVVAEYGQVRHVASRRKTGGDRAYPAQDSLAGQAVQVGRPCGLQRRSISQFGNRVIGHAVADENDVFP